MKVWNTVADFINCVDQWKIHFMSFWQYIYTKRAAVVNPGRQLKAGSEIKYLGLTLLTSCSNWSLILCAVANSVHFNRRRTWSTGPPLKWTPFNTQIKNLWTHEYKTFQYTNTNPYNKQIYIFQCTNTNTFEHTNKKPFNKKIQILSIDHNTQINIARIAKAVQ